MAQTVKNLSAVQETWVWSLGWEDRLEKGKAAHSSILAWRIPRTEEPGGLPSMGSQRWTWLNNWHTHLRGLREQALHLRGESHFKGQKRPCQDPEARAWSLHSRNWKATTVAGIEWAGERMAVYKVSRKITGGLMSPRQWMDFILRDSVWPDFVRGSHQLPSRANSSGWVRRSIIKSLVTQEFHSGG